MNRPMPESPQVECRGALNDTALVRATGALKPLGGRVKREDGAFQTKPSLPPQR